MAKGCRVRWRAFIGLSLCLCASVVSAFGHSRQNRAHGDALAGGVDGAEEELPVRLGIGRRRLADLDEDRVLAGPQADREAMAIVADAVAIFLEAEDALAVDVDGEVVV